MSSSLSHDDAIISIVQILHPGNLSVANFSTIRHVSTFGVKLATTRIIFILEQISKKYSLTERWRVLMRLQATTSVCFFYHAKAEGRFESFRGIFNLITDRSLIVAFVVAVF